MLYRMVSRIQSCRHRMLEPLFRGCCHRTVADRPLEQFPSLVSEPGVQVVLRQVEEAALLGE